MSRARQIDDALFASVRIRNQRLKLWRNYFIVLRQQENGRRVTGFRVRDAIESRRKFQRERTGE